MDDHRHFVRYDNFFFYLLCLCQTFEHSDIHSTTRLFTEFFGQFPPLDCSIFHQLKAGIAFEIAGLSKFLYLLLWQQRVAN